MVAGSAQQDLPAACVLCDETATHGLLGHRWTCGHAKAVSGHSRERHAGRAPGAGTEAEQVPRAV